MEIRFKCLAVVAGLMIATAACAGGADRIVSVLLVVDAQAQSEQGSETESWARQQYFAMRDSYAATTPFAVGLAGVEIQVGSDPWVVTPDGQGEVDVTELLLAFNNWHASATLPSHDFAVLLSGYEFQGSNVELSFAATVCGGSNTTGVIQAGVGLAGATALVSRSLGLGLGACNDPPGFRGGSCPPLPPMADCSGFIMAPALNLSSPPDQFSACSVSDFQQRISAGDLNCLSLAGPSFSVGGAVTGLQGQGLTMALSTPSVASDDPARLLAVTGDGQFTFPALLPDGANWDVSVETQPVSPSQQCSLTGASGTIAGADETDVQVICANPQTDLSISKDDGETIFSAGNPLTYLIEVRNLGMIDVVGASVTDVLPAALGSATWTCTPSAGAVCSASGSGDIDEVVDLPSGSTVLFTLTAATAADFQGVVENNASVTAPSGFDDSNGANNMASDRSATGGIFSDGFETPLLNVKRRVLRIMRHN